MSYALNLTTVTLPDTEEAQLPVSDIKIKKIKDIIVHGRVVDCNGDPVACAIVKAFDKTTGAGIVHTFTGPDGEYMFNLDYDLYKGKEIKIKAVKTNNPSNCNCPT